jgi:hypothetical protein
MATLSNLKATTGGTPPAEPPRTKALIDACPYLASSNTTLVVMIRDV